MKIIAHTPMGKFESGDVELNELDRENAITLVTNEIHRGKLTLRDDNRVVFIHMDALKQSVVEIRF